MENNHILILGGARSGKSMLGEKIALKLSDRPAYIATAQTGDKEMQDRVAEHRIRRGERFTTFEESLALAKTIQIAAKDHDTILVDCLTLWLSNLIFSETTDKAQNISALGDVLKTSKSRIILISNEVGLGIVPDNGLARQFRDDAGSMHQELAKICANVYIIFAGLPMVLKGELPDID
jgi:adenosylcobinamide kinase/adenosylcobinamide-phosphate guanylyltransferase